MNSATTATYWTDKRIIFVAKVVLCSLFLYSFFVLLANTLLVPITFTYSVCMNGPEPVNPLIHVILFTCPVLILLVSTASMDYSAWSVFKTTRKHRKSIDDIPLRATIISSILFVVHFIFCMIVGNFIVFQSPVTKWQWLARITSIILSLRNPIISYFAFRANKANQKADRNKRRQKIELEARNERENRLLIKADHDQEVINIQEACLPKNQEATNGKSEEKSVRTRRASL